MVSVHDVLDARVGCRYCICIGEDMDDLVAPLFLQLGSGLTTLIAPPFV